MKYGPRDEGASVEETFSRTTINNTDAWTAQLTEPPGPDCGCWRNLTCNLGKLTYLSLCILLRKADIGC